MPTTAAKNKGIVIQKLNIFLQPFKDRHERHYRDSHFHFWADMLLAGMLVGSFVTLIWLMVWQPKPDFVLEPRFVDARVISGHPQNFFVMYENDEGAAIDSVSLKLDLPDYMQIVSTDSEAMYDVNAQSFMIGDLKEGQSGKIGFTALVRGAIGEHQSLGFSLMYQRGQIKKQVLASLPYRIDGSALNLSMDIPEKNYRGIPFNGAVTVKNEGSAQIDRAAIGFTPELWEITPDGTVLEEGRISIVDLKPGEERRISFQATADEVGENLNFGVEGFLIVDSLALSQSMQERKISITEPSLSVSASFGQSAFSESPVDLSLNITNNDQSDISDISFSIQSQRDTLAVTAVTTTGDNSAANNTVNVPVSLKPSETRKLNLAVALKRQSTQLNDFLSLSIDVTYKMNSETFSYSLAAPKLKVNSNLSVTSAGFYYGPQGDQLGIGPIPPQVDIPTTYWIIWEANNLGNDVAEFEVKADLPANVVWLDQKSLVAGELSYSPVTRRIVWKIDKLAQTGGNYRASFSISIVPRIEDIGKVPNLLSAISFTGVDQYSQARISKNLPNITTNIEKDPQAGGRGKVVASE